MINLKKTATAKAVRPASRFNLKKATDVTPSARFNLRKH